MDLNYTITKFDNENKFVVVTFEDGTWAEIRLRNPLPKTKNELEDIIKRYAATEEAVMTITNPDADLSYIESLVGVSEITARYSIEKAKQELKDKAEQIAAEEKLKNAAELQKSLSGSPDALAMWEKVQFEQSIGDALVKFGILQTNPAKIGVSEV